MSSCSSELDFKSYSRYIHGVWLPLLIEQRDAGKIVKTKKVITVAFGKENKMFDYEGEVDDLGRAHGYGHATEFGESWKKALKCSGTFKHDKPHGIRKFFIHFLMKFNSCMGI